MEVQVNSVNHPLENYSSIELIHHFREHGKKGVVVEVLQHEVHGVHLHLQRKNHIFINKHPFLPVYGKLLQNCSKTGS